MTGNHTKTVATDYRPINVKIFTRSNDSGSGIASGVLHQHGYKIAEGNADLCDRVHGLVSGIAGHGRRAGAGLISPPELTDPVGRTLDHPVCSARFTHHKLCGFQGRLLIGFEVKYHRDRLAR